jgi:DNA ligase-1
MRAFAELYEELDTTTSTTLKVDAMVRYFRGSPPADAAWAAYILSGHRLKRFIGPALLWRWLLDVVALPQWLIEESYASVGDLAESIALLMDRNGTRAEPADTPLADWVENRLLALRNADEPHQRAVITGWWRTLPYRECFLLNKLLTGELRVGVSRLLVTRALAEVTQLPRAEIAHRLTGNWWPSEAFWHALHSAERRTADPSAPYPFLLAFPLDEDPSTLGPREAWLAEWKWDGIRGQLIRRDGRTFIWSRGEDLVTERFPEIVNASRKLPDGMVLDGELVAWRDGDVQPFSDLQQRIGRKKLTAAILAAVPVHFLAYDLLEEEGVDTRHLPLRERRSRLEQVLGEASGALGISPAVVANSWDELATVRAQSRERRVEGLMLKALDSA